MKKILFFILILSFNTNALASVKQNIINNLNNIENLNFKFEQNINDKIETGYCIIEYPKKIFCEYDSLNKKLLVSNGRSIVIKTKSSYYLYPIKRTPLNSILDKEFLLKKIEKLEPRSIDNKFINFNFLENENEINLFFDKKSFNLIGWQTIDIYQNLSITYLSSITKNLKLKKNLFKLPDRN
ncbi:outer-membrane lipoprotein carrier protein LolA [Candidatus Pelagibacter sp.]|nr:outer-membrane lipoprotein carrier protein LolA [Candidatus Pelagibacter sp.]